jgi:uncharacterized membrane protein YfcA
MLPLLASALLVGMFVGAVGIGGVLLVPALMIFSHLTVHEAAATALFTFLFTGLLGTWLFARRGTLPWRACLPACLGAAPFGFLGAFAGSRLPSGMLVSIVALVLAGTGIYILSLRGNPAAAPWNRNAGPLAMFGIGAVSGFGAAVSGAGGPLFSVPIMLAMHFDPLVAVASGQVVQIAASLSGSFGNLGHGTIHYGLAAPVTAAELAGVLAGVRIAHSVDGGKLRIGAAVLCIVSAVALAAKHLAG